MLPVTDSCIQAKKYGLMLFQRFLSLLYVYQGLYACSVEAFDYSVRHFEAALQVRIKGVSPRYGSLHPFPCASTVYLVIPIDPIQYMENRQREWQGLCRSRYLTPGSLKISPCLLLSKCTAAASMGVLNRFYSIHHPKS